MVALSMAYKFAYHPASTINGKRPVDYSGAAGMGECSDPGRGDGEVVE